MGDMHKMNRPPMLLAQGFAQDAEQRTQPGTGGQQPQRPVVPGGIVMQRTAAQFTQADRVPHIQGSSPVDKLPGLAAIEVKLQETVLLRQARQGIGPGDVAEPQHQVLPGLVAQRPFRGDAQTQHVGAQPVRRHHLGSLTVTLRIERMDLHIFDHLALAGQPPALIALCRAQGIGPSVAHIAAGALHQAGVTTAGATTVGHRHPGLIQRVQQVTARRDRPLPAGDRQFRHRHSPRRRHTDYGRLAWHGTRPGRHVAMRCPGHRPSPTASCPPTG
ncbi:hypothetical protein ALO79_200291 [Pseudomonas syringae pv. castaneae]|uniref:Uncharacterized protein n=1 Tax=Pseudomonas syringae pv. castaneae TaxID=264450 RepID=A0A0P9PLI5_PSESX|nr:hypothetical protein ALO79_200291 [Pseudomonas syringae pv. castaneae]